MKNAHEVLSVFVAMTALQYYANLPIMAILGKLADLEHNLPYTCSILLFAQNLTKKRHDFKKNKTIFSEKIPSHIKDGGSTAL